MNTLRQAFKEAGIELEEVEFNVNGEVISLKAAEKLVKYLAIIEWHAGNREGRIFYRMKRALSLDVDGYVDAYWIEVEEKDIDIGAEELGYGGGIHG